MRSNFFRKSRIKVQIFQVEGEKSGPLYDNLAKLLGGGHVPPPGATSMSMVSVLIGNVMDTPSSIGYNPMRSQVGYDKVAYYMHG